MELEELEELLLEHCYDMTILKRDAPIKKKDSILDSLISAIVRSKTPYEDIKLCIDDVNSDNVIDINFFNVGGNVEDFINPKWLNFSKALWRQRSVGLGTPNAASGEGELMFIFLSTHIEKPTRGDLSINGESIELKGEGVRVSGNITGKRFRKLSVDLSKEFGLIPNITNRTNKEGVELEKVGHEEHWINQLDKLSIENRKKFISGYLNIMDDNDHIVDDLFIEDTLDFHNLRKRIVKILYQSMVEDRNFDKFIILGDGSEAKILSDDINSFNEKVDNGIIEIESDYFRINQDNKIGWYIK